MPCLKDSKSGVKGCGDEIPLSCNLSSPVEEVTRQIGNQERLCSSQVSIELEVRQTSPKSSLLKSIRSMGSFRSLKPSLTGLRNQVQPSPREKALKSCSQKHFIRHQELSSNPDFFSGAEEQGDGVLSKEAQAAACALRQAQSFNLSLDAEEDKTAIALKVALHEAPTGQGPPSPLPWASISAPGPSSPTHGPNSPTLRPDRSAPGPSNTATGPNSRAPRPSSPTSGSFEAHADGLPNGAQQIRLEADVDRGTPPIWSVLAAAQPASRESHSGCINRAEPTGDPTLLSPTNGGPSPTERSKQSIQNSKLEKSRMSFSTRGANRVLPAKISIPHSLLELEQGGPSPSSPSSTKPQVLSPSQNSLSVLTFLSRGSNRVIPTLRIADPCGWMYGCGPQLSPSLSSQMQHHHACDSPGILDESLLAGLSTQLRRQRSFSGTSDSHSMEMRRIQMPDENEQENERRGFLRGSAPRLGMQDWAKVQSASASMSILPSGWALSTNSFTTRLGGHDLSQAQAQTMQGSSSVAGLARHSQASTCSLHPSKAPSSLLNPQGHVSPQGWPEDEEVQPSEGSHRNRSMGAQPWEEAQASEGRASKARPSFMRRSTSDMVLDMLGDGHPTALDLVSTRIHVITFNMGNKVPTEVPASLFGLHRQQPDIFMIGTQECGSCTLWEQLIASTLDPSEYVKVASETLMQISMLLYVRRHIAPHIRNLRTSTVTTGVGNVIGNKGGVAASFSLAGLRILLVTSHLAAHDAFVERRNMDFSRIFSGLSSMSASASSGAERRSSFMNRTPNQVSPTQPAPEPQGAWPNFGNLLQGSLASGSAPRQGSLAGAAHRLSSPTGASPDWFNSPSALSPTGQSTHHRPTSLHQLRGTVPTGRPKIVSDNASFSTTRASSPCVACEDLSLDQGQSQGQGLGPGLEPGAGLRPYEAVSGFDTGLCPSRPSEVVVELDTGLCRSPQPMSRGVEDGTGQETGACGSIGRWQDGDGWETGMCRISPHCLGPPLKAASTHATSPAAGQVQSPHPAASGSSKTEQSGKDQAMFPTSLITDSSKEGQSPQRRSPFGPQQTGNIVTESAPSSGGSQHGQSPLPMPLSTHRQLHDTDPCLQKGGSVTEALAASAAIRRLQNTLQMSVLGSIQAGSSGDAQAGSSGNAQAGSSGNAQAGSSGTKQAGVGQERSSSTGRGSSRRVNVVSDVNTHDLVIWCGDLNYRINGSAAEVKHLVESGNMDVLHARDQLKIQQAKGLAFQGFSEQLIRFPPTFKFIPGTNEYNPKRVPSWTDRILLKWNNNHGSNCSVKPLYYSSVPEVTESDHRPVVAGYVLSLCPDRRLYPFQRGEDDLATASNCSIC